MSQTVGYTCAIATRLVLLKQFEHTGVLSPTHKEIYQPILEQLAQIGIHMQESEELLPEKPITKAQT